MTDPGGGYGWRAGSTPCSLGGRRARGAGERRDPPPIAVLLLPRELESVHPARPGRGSADARPAWWPSSPRGSPTARICGCPRRSPTAWRRRRRGGCGCPGVPRAIVIFHPLQYPLARGLIAQHPDARALVLALGPLRGRLRRDAAPARAAGGAAPGREHARRGDDRRLRRARRARARGGRRAAARPARRRLVPGARPGRDGRRGVARAPRPPHRLGAAARGRRGDAGARAAADRRVARGRVRPRPDYQACRAAPNLVWLGRRSRRGGGAADPCADVGIVPFERSEFNDTALPYRILKYARLGRRTIAPDLRACARGSAR